MQVQQLSPIDLPIAKHLPSILTLIQSNPVVVISGKTGCGKSTQVPKAIWKANPKARIAVCQPRRVAATSLAVRVAEEIGCKLGSSVGYHIGMESFKNEKCPIIYMTYGIIIQQLLFKSQLPYTHIVLDQIHQRSLQMDFSFVAFKNLMNQRKIEGKTTAKLIIMSATLNSKEFAVYFSTHPNNSLFFIPQVTAQENGQQVRGRGNRYGRNQKKQGYKLSQMSSEYIEAATYEIPEQKLFKVEQIFWSGQNLYSSSGEDEPRLFQNIVDEAIKIVQNLTLQNSNGDILFFLPGYYEIQMVKHRLIDKNYAEQRIVEVHSIFSEELYEKLFQSRIKNKLILATNIGQSSITLPFCKVVMDFCLTKRNSVRQKGISQLQTRFTSKASMTQRAGRVGRVADGLVFRMITKEFYQTLSQYEQPQIKCINLQMVILRAKQLDFINNSKVFSDPYKFLLGVMNPPDIQAIKQSIQYLLEEEALLGPGSKINQAHLLQLSKIGQFLVSMPCDMHISKMILMGIKLQIPGLITVIASIMIATKNFFVHQQRRQNIEEFMHSLIGYDYGLSNDFLLRERLFNHWKQKFYYPMKQKKMYKKKVTSISRKQNEQTKYSRIYQTGDQQEEIFNFLQEFTQQKWTQKQKDFCFPKGVSMTILRQIIKIEESLKVRLTNLGVVFKSDQQRNIKLFLLCFAYAFPNNDCQIHQGKYIKNNIKQLNYIQIPTDWNFSDKIIQQYIFPQKQFEIHRGPKYIQIYGAPNVLKKFIFPQYFHKNSLNKKVSYLYQNLVRYKVQNKFECDIKHSAYQVTILNESVNRVLIMNDYKKKYKLLTNQFSMSGNRTMVKMTALIQEDLFLLMQLITCKDVKVSLHPSREMLNSYNISGRVFDFKKIITQKQLNVIRSLRSVAIRKNTNNIHSQQQVMSNSDIDTLLNFFQHNKSQHFERQPWEQTFISTKYGTFKQQFYPLSHPLQFKDAGSHFEAYKKWKINEYYHYLILYKSLLMQEFYIICAKCQHYQTIDHISFYDHQTKVLKLNQFSGNWRVENKYLYCQQGHKIGIIQIEGQTAILQPTAVCIYVPCNRRQDLWKNWPSKQQLSQMQIINKQQVQKLRSNLQDFLCPFCFDKKDEKSHRYFSRNIMGQNFWKNLRDHLRSHQHIQASSTFKNSIKHKKK